jgi:hypothetical protein
MWQFFPTYVSHKARRNLIRQLVRDVFRGYDYQHEVLIIQTLQKGFGMLEEESDPASKSKSVGSARDVNHKVALEVLDTGKVNVLKSTGLHLKYRCRIFL